METKLDKLLEIIYSLNDAVIVLEDLNCRIDTNPTITEFYKYKNDMTPPNHKDMVVNESFKTQVENLLKTQGRIIIREKVISNHKTEVSNYYEIVLCENEWASYEEETLKKKFEGFHDSNTSYEPFANKEIFLWN